MDEWTERAFVNSLCTAFGIRYKVSRSQFVTACTMSHDCSADVVGLKFKSTSTIEVYINNNRALGLDQILKFLKSRRYRVA